MDKQIKDILSEAFHGNDAHIDPVKVITDLSFELAIQNLEEVPSSKTIWDNLHHMVIWQDVCINAIEGNEVDWEVIETINWPDEEIHEEERTPETFENLKQKFVEDSNKLKQLLFEKNLEQKVPGWNNAPLFKVFMVIIQHNSYHIAQIIQLKKYLEQEY